MTGLIILAAGCSSRLGEPKQNLVFDNKTLLQRAIDAGRGSGCNPVIVVLGANAGAIVPVISGQDDILIVINPEWQEGIASSIRTGLAEIEKDDRVSNAIIMLCDQPFVDAALLQKLILAKQQSGKNIVACSYAGTIGVPALFDRILFAKLLKLQGQDGAKKILKDHPDDVATIEFDKGNIDIDTKGDYDHLLNAGN
ncbi:nucleotidyltransferase family protein [Mucilaginibacter ginsenosidivorans]|uniref:Nucleotidyltransferase family protein n=1 Tax=Mucilaginibacter ginsenosidivorans TaxID=398053 RepID=A0A5B8V134_9SPHI|nr:nucleotidyltransferase family protein [Mucilaginibacter ginsenosidivorans]QEC64735.1 nucleotidyltransferase family protein [Mucilaginibacter ginsenosidivorans]